MNKIITQEIKLGEKTLILEHGRFAEQANSAVVARMGDTMVLVTVVATPLKMELDYFPLTVDYTMRLYAGGRIKGSRWVKRDGRPTDDEILTCRLIDRSIRPLFPKNYKKEVQVIALVISADSENDPAILAMAAVSAALASSGMPWKGPVGSVRVGGAKDGGYIVNPTASELESSELDLVLTTNGENIFMIEAGAQQVPEEKILEALDFGQKEAQKLIDGINELVKKIGKPKDVYEEKEEIDISSLVEEKFGDKIFQFAKDNASKEGGSSGSELKAEIIASVGEENAPYVGAAFDKVMKKKVRQQIISGSRLDGRKLDQVREITCETSVLPRTHGSAVFKRGQTQVLSALTLGSPNMSLLLETAEGEQTKHYLHFYNMPPYASGETGRYGQPGRREIGHGALAERALLPVLPAMDKFPYTIQIVSEVMSSNGSTSMASTCGSTLSLMDAGVPILAPVSGIAMGLIIEDGKEAVLTDIMGIEDGMGDMDFKVAGTKDGVTAIQLDVKTPLLTLEILTRALEQAKAGRFFILEKMLATIDTPRTNVSQYAPKIVVVKIPVEKIGELIGPGGKNIKKIMAQTGAQLDVEDDGAVTISGVSPDSVDSAREWIIGMTKEVQAGEIYEGEVVRMQPFGAFVNILPGKDGLVHVSDMAEEFVKDPYEIVKEGDKIQVRVKEVDDLGRINLSMLLDPAKDAEKQSQRNNERSGGESRGTGSTRFGEAGRGPRRSMGPRRDDRGSSGPRRDSRSSSGSRREGGEGGPHFPASRFMPNKKRF